MLVKDSKIRRQRIEHLQQQYHCDVAGLLRNHRDMLTGSLIGQCQYMYFERYGRYFRRDEPEDDV